MTQTWAFCLLCCLPCFVVALAGRPHTRSQANRALASTTCERSRWENTISRDLELLQATRVHREHLNIGEKQIYGGWRVMIHDQKLYAKPVGEYNDPFKHSLLMVIAKAMCRYQFPNVEFIINAYSRKASTNSSHASVVFSATKDPARDQDVVMPYQSMLWPKSHPRSYEDVHIPWEQREPRAVWRGTTSGGVFTKYTWRHLTRSRISLLCKERPDLCDVGFSSLDQTHTTPEATQEMTVELGAKAPISMKDMAKYKYIVAVDGHTAPTSRIAHLLYSGSAIFKQESPFQEFWYNDFKPYTHYIPLSYDGSDLLEKIEWARQHDEEVRQIVANARAFAEESFTDENIACFVYRLLSRYAALQEFQPAPDAEMANWRVRYTQQRFAYLRENSDFECTHFNNGE